MAKPKKTTAMIASTQFNTPPFQEVFHAGISHSAMASNELSTTPSLAWEIKLPPEVSHT
jgi:hypothetical protein